MFRTVAVMVLGGGLVAATGCSRQASVQSGVEAQPQVTPVTTTALPAGAAITVRLNEALGTESSEVGDEFTATVASDVRTRDGGLVVPAGAMVYGKVTGLDDSDQVGDDAYIRLDFDRIAFNGESYPFEAQVKATELESQGDTRQETLQKAGIGAAAGAVLGAVVGDVELDDILIGAAVGAAAGTIISLGAGDVEAVLPAGSTMQLQTTQMVSLR
ncbi:MAG: YMGG-like glycine zipper-containing protein [Gemmatimonadaceae bacterium]